EAAFEMIAAPERHIGDTVQDDVDLARVDVVMLFKNAPAGIGEHDDCIAAVAQLTGDKAHALIRLRQGCMKRDDDRLAKLGEKVEQIIASFTAEKAVLVLDVDDVGWVV